jgi:hypothetical protein
LINTPTATSVTMESVIESVNNPWALLFSGSVAKGGWFSMNEDPRNYRFFQVMLDDQNIGLMCYWNPQKTYISGCGSWDDGTSTYVNTALIANAGSADPSKRYQLISASYHTLLASSTLGYAQNVTAIYGCR